jgi:hypothetical protein
MFCRAGWFSKYRKNNSIEITVCGLDLDRGRGICLWNYNRRFVAVVIWLQIDLILIYPTDIHCTNNEITIFVVGSKIISILTVFSKTYGSIWVLSSLGGSNQSVIRSKSKYLIFKSLVFVYTAKAKSSKTKTFEFRYQHISMGNFLLSFKHHSRKTCCDWK